MYILQILKEKTECHHIQFLKGDVENNESIENTQILHKYFSSNLYHN